MRRPQITLKAGRRKEEKNFLAEPDSLPPPLKWAGGKRWLVPYLRKYWKNNTKYRLVEPLCGGLAVTLGLKPERALLNDVNIHVINFYHHLKEGLKIRRELRNDREFYYLRREEFNLIVKSGRAKSLRAAELFYYLNRTCYNGLCRFNSSGEFNVPFGKYSTINYEYDFTRYKDVFAKWEFTAEDFESLELQPDDFVYADPPYDVQFTKYSRDDFKWKDQIRLVRWLKEHKGAVIISNQATGRIVDLYERNGFIIKEKIPAPRRISCTGDRTPAIEVLAIRGLE